MTPEEMALGACQDEKLAGVHNPVRETPDAAAVDFEGLFERYHEMVYGLVLRVLGNREEALDVSQEVFITIYRKLDGFRGECSLKTWIYRIALNLAANRCRWWNRLRRRGSVSLDAHLAGDGVRRYSETVMSGDRSPEQSLLLREEQDQIRCSLLRLPIQQRVAVVMRDIEGMSYEEIAGAMKVSLGTVKSRIARGRNELKRRLNGVLG